MLCSRIGAQHLAVGGQREHRHRRLVQCRLERLQALLRYTQSTAYSLPHAVAPVDIVGANDGTLVTLDEWAQVRRGVVHTVRTADGKSAHRYTLAGLLEDKAAAGAPSTVMSTWWRCGEPGLIAAGYVLRVTTYDEGELRVDLRDGAVDYTPGHGRCR